MTKQAILYGVKVNQRGEMLILLNPAEPYKGDPDNPEIAYDGGEHAVLYRNGSDAVTLDYFPESERTRLMSAKSVLVAEYDTSIQDIRHEYMAAVVKVAEMFDMSEGLLTKEQVEAEVNKLKKKKEG